MSALLYWIKGGGTIVRLGDENLNLRRAAEAALSLAEIVEQVRAKALQRAEKDARAAFRLQWGLDG